MLKILATCVLFGLAIYTAATSGPLFETFTHTPLWILLVVALGYSLGQCLSALKWWLLVRASGIEASFVSAIKAYFMGMFANCFGLGVVGGDVARALLLGGEKKSKALATVAADRVHGLFSLSFLGAVAGFLLWLSSDYSQNPVYLTLLICISGGLLVMWFLGPYIVTLIPGEHKILRKVRDLSLAFPKSPGVLIVATLLSMIFHCSQLALYFIMGLSFGVKIPLEYIAVAIPLTNIVSTLPITWNGLGVRENALSFFLVPAVISSTQSVAFGAIWLAAVMITSAIGGILAFWSKDFRGVIEGNAEDLKAEDL